MSALRFEPAVVPASVLAHYRRSGYQSDVTISALLARNQREFGTLPAVIDGRHRRSWGELVDAAARFAGFLAAAGVGPGDVVTWQLPNWWESLVVAYGIWAAGAVSNPVTEISREHELRQIVEQVHPVCVVTAEQFRDCRHAEMWTEVCRQTGNALRGQVVVRGSASGWTTFADTLVSRPAVLESLDVDVDEPALVVMTSGTTSGAKGVVHSTRSYLSYPLRTCRWVGAGWADRTLSPFPLGHVSGMIWAIAVPLFIGGSTVIADRWDPEFAVHAIRDGGVTYTGGPALFAREILDVLASQGIEHLALPKGFTCGASAFTTELAEAIERAGLGANRAYGMSECPTVSGSTAFDPFDVRLETDGRIAPGCEIRVTDDRRRDVAPGAVGEFVVRGPHRALGYLDAAQSKEAFDAEGWFRTGDLGTLSAEGLVTVTGRLKEIINRGGEKISAREVEDVLTLHPAVFEAAVVPAPHDRYGEEPAAFVLLRQGQSVSSADLASFLRDRGLAAQKIPRRWSYVDELPRTAAGKVKKYELVAALDTEGENREGAGEPPSP